jgi:hypothetical protein
MTLMGCKPRSQRQRAAPKISRWRLSTLKLGQLADAIQFEERFLAAKRADLTQSEIDQSEGRLSRLRAKLIGPIGGPMPTTETARRVPPAAIGLLSGGASAGRRHRLRSGSAERPRPPVCRRLRR